MHFETFRQAVIEEQPETLVERFDQIDGRGREVLRLSRFVRLHDGKPRREIGVVRGNLVLTGAPHGERAPRGSEYGEAGRGAERLLTRGQRDVDSPRIVSELLSSNGANAVDD